MKEIPLTRGFVALVDDADFESLAQHRWCVKIERHGRRLAEAMRKDGKRSVVMHRVIMNAAPGQVVDHVRHQPLEDKVIDNRRGNLRLATTSQNQANSRKLSSATSLFKGVRWHKGKWTAAIQARKIRESLGCFAVEAHAALAYDLAAVRLFGEYALTNFPVPGSQSWPFGTPEEG